MERMALTWRNDDREAPDDMGMGGNLNSTIEFEAAEGQTIYLFIDYRAHITA